MYARWSLLFSEGENLQKRKMTEAQSIRVLARKIETQLHSIRQRLRRQLEAEYARGNLTGPQRLIMELLCRSDGMNLKQLSQAACLAHSTVSGIVDRLEAHGLVQRKTDEKDRRVTQITPSPAVREFLERRAPALTLHPLTKALNQATPAQRAAIRRGLNILEQLLTQS
jgi:DNA-binding MarR family transcriptional regulator